MGEKCEKVNEAAGTVLLCYLIYFETLSKAVFVSADSNHTQLPIRIGT